MASCFRFEMWRLVRRQRGCFLYVETVVVMLPDTDDAIRKSHAGGETCRQQRWVMKRDCKTLSFIYSYYLFLFVIINKLVVEMFACIASYI